MKGGRVALRLAYIGERYYGYSKQPGFVTVEGELLNALEKLGICRRIKSACRTDKGVNALSQVVAFDTVSEHTEPRMINQELPPDIFVYARCFPPSSFDPRADAKLRVYKYFLRDCGYDVDRMLDASEILIGTHDFSSFSSEKGVVKTVEHIDVKKVGEFVEIEVAARSFAREMVRRIVTALSDVGSGSRDKGWIKEVLESKGKIGVRAARPEGLILWDVRYDGIEWEIDEYARRVAVQKLEDYLTLHSTMARVAEEMKRELSR